MATKRNSQQTQLPSVVLRPSKLSKDEQPFLHSSASGHYMSQASYSSCSFENDREKMWSDFLGAGAKQLGRHMIVQYFDEFHGCKFLKIGRQNGRHFEKTPSVVRFSLFQANRVLDLIKRIITEDGTTSKFALIPFFGGDEQRANESPSYNNFDIFWMKPDLDMGSVRVRVTKDGVTGSYVLNLNRLGKEDSNGSTIRLNIRECKSLADYIEEKNLEDIQEQEERDWETSQLVFEQTSQLADLVIDEEAGVLTQKDNE